MIVESWFWVPRETLRVRVGSLRGNWYLVSVSVVSFHLQYPSHVQCVCINATQGISPVPFTKRNLAAAILQQPQRMQVVVG